MKIIKPEEKDWFEGKGYSKKVLLDEDDLGLPGVWVQEVLIKAGGTASLHYHKKQTEIFYFFDSNGYWLINGKKFTFGTGDALVIEPNDRHEVVNDTKEEYRYLCFKQNYEEGDFYED
ncbi:MAG: hypothetical protein A2186_00490 [Candidatus Levybacteria bacterium RIFOXYA1_FULL_41_10]|nr:MAG: Cupin 2 conserved barrel domain protein [Candidatus Levybacteria bacterium GW2011_GWA1_39_32]KKR50927.1 MAG: Cupin 2 conserved barrel domain protein [Candidatus Levybacteria bacterium GW2011_GWC1_40_19]OGH26613.1 MAG: hypothetical protein A3D82_04065 [Candidatus Levybacteria bacterium RIFCSPHIGHO2_02_FULL_40_29]OGH32748.1 MAG: hypothetical protein A3E70_00985 [Candidatus Levybacteria bacterium RIFCSPHIGHO2_12_FULL_40_44]OGH42179.1 MAG: hypothetical protein A2965_03465 [Candidatus Levyba